MDTAVINIDTCNVANLETDIKMHGTVEKAKLKIVNLLTQLPGKMRTYRLQAAVAEYKMAVHELETFRNAAVKKSIDELLADANVSLE